MNSQFRSLVSRIVWLHLAAVVVAAGTMIVSIHLLLNATFAAFERRALSEHAAAVAEAVAPAGAGLAVKLPSELKDFYAHGYGGFEFAVLDATGRPAASSRPDGEALFPKAPLRAAPEYFQRIVGSDAHFDAIFPERLGDRSYWVEISQNLDHPGVYADDIVAQFLGQVFWLVLPIILLLLAVDAFIVRRALRPVIAASTQANSIHPSQIDIRLPVRGLPTEVAPLVTAMNQALDRLAAGFRLQREFVADVAHELRTPLAVLRLRADKVEDRAIADGLRADIDAMSRLVEQLLAHAEFEAFVLPPDARADLRAVALDVASFMAPSAIAAGKQVAVSVGEAPVWVHGHAESLFRALRNLVENGIAHSPPRGVVTIEVESDGVMRVSDEGPGVPVSDREVIFQRSWRRDRRKPGAGLGLSIVASIIQRHDGAIDVGSAKSGGVCFTLRLRPAPA
ncbi:MAG: HAMP domain-containing histidine kinase [Hyphomicrobiales bacterium]|nr:HAMP domain-containing histidine kinase [Hyphomicrobiales bacterium]